MKLNISMSKYYITSDVEESAEVIDPISGNKVKTKVTKSKAFSSKVTNEKFYMVFLEALSTLMDMGSATDRKVLDQLCQKATFNTGVVDLTPKKRGVICEAIGITRQSLSNCLQNLKNRNVIKLDRGECTINPQFFWKGDTTTRSKMMEDSALRITFDFQADALVEVKDELEPNEEF